jgi:hypothetical protein
LFSKIISNKVTSPKVHFAQIHLHIALILPLRSIASINSIKLEGELQATLGSLGQILPTKFVLSKLSYCKQHLEFVRIPTNEKILLAFI